MARFPACLQAANCLALSARMEGLERAALCALVGLCSWEEAPASPAASSAAGSLGVSYFHSPPTGPRRAAAALPPGESEEVAGSKRRRHVGGSAEVGSLARSEMRPGVAVDPTSPPPPAASLMFRHPHACQVREERTLIRARGMGSVCVCELAGRECLMGGRADLTTRAVPLAALLQHLRALRQARVAHVTRARH